MSYGYTPNDYRITKTGVTFRTSDADLQRTFDRAEELCRKNLMEYGEYTVLREGAKYNGVWPETQPMGGEMYASRNMLPALCNHLIFMKYQLRNGRIPGMITFGLPYNGTAPRYDWMQGDFFTVSAMRMYYWLGEDKEYLKRLYITLRDFDDYLWTYRANNANGILETWCTWDTGDDNCSRLMYHGVSAVEDGLHNGETPPADHGDMPIQSAEYMAYSYSRRLTLAKISAILGNGEEKIWLDRAEEVRSKSEKVLWDDTRKAFFDRDRNGNVIDCLSMENIKCMYHGLFTQEQADDFIRLHLLNPDEFFTFCPVPNIAANDPLFYVNENLNNWKDEIRAKIKPQMNHDMSDNSWSGPSAGLIQCRLIEALLRYGHHKELTVFAHKWVDNLVKVGKFVQQFNPMTGEPAPGDDGYGPSLLSFLEYVTHLYGIDFKENTLLFSCGEGADSTFTQHLFGHDYTLTLQGNTATADKDGKILFTRPRGERVFTDLDGNILETFEM